jgi:hypothetical protein
MPGLRALCLSVLPLVLVGCAGDPAMDDSDSDFPDGPGSWGGGKDDTTESNVPYHGGRVLHAPLEQHVYWGSYWSTSTGQDDRAVLDGFAGSAGGSAWWKVVDQYTDADGAPGRPAPGDPVVIDDSDPASTVSDRAIRAFLLAQINAGTLAWDDQTVFFVFTPPHVVVSTPWGKSCGAICGYHYHFTGSVHGHSRDVLYATIPYLACANGCGAPGVHVNGSSLDQMTVTLSHELAESVTDPDITAWTGPKGDGEVGDLCNDGAALSWDGSAYAVQDIWSNAKHACVH